jgi:hypothetical protein
MISNSNSAVYADYSGIAYLIAGKAVAAIVLGIEAESLSLVKDPPADWEITLKLDPKCRKATIEEFAIIEICGRWAESTVTYRQITAKNPTTRRGNPPDWLDTPFVKRKAEFIIANYREAIKQVAEQLKARRFMNAAEIREAIHDGLAIAGRIH